MRRTDKLTTATKNNKIRRLNKHIKMVTRVVSIEGLDDTIICNDKNAKEKLAILMKL